MSFVNVNAANRWSVFIIIIVIVTVMVMVGGCIYSEIEITRENMSSDWNTAIASYDDDDCVSTWDQISGGVQSLATFGSFTDIDRAKLIENDSGAPKYTTCIKRTANYTLVCPSDTIRVIGCNGTTYKNSCYAERDGIYNYSTENGVVKN